MINLILERKAEVLQHIKYKYQGYSKVLLQPGPDVVGICYEFLLQHLADKLEVKRWELHP